MLDISIEVNGRRVQPGQMEAALEKAAVEEAIQSVKQEVCAIRCPKHGNTAKVLARGKTLANLKFEIDGCCDTLLEAVQAKLR